MPAACFSQVTRILFPMIPHNAGPCVLSCAIMTIVVKPPPYFLIYLISQRKELAKLRRKVKVNFFLLFVRFQWYSMYSPKGEDPEFVWWLLCYIIESYQFQHDIFIHVSLTKRFSSFPLYIVLFCGPLLLVLCPFPIRPCIYYIISVSQLP